MSTDITINCSSGSCITQQQQKQQHQSQQLNNSCSNLKREKHTVHWFRKGLRLHDNPALRAGINGATTLRCIFVIDPYFAGSSNVGINKWRFLLQCLEDLDRSLRKLNSRLFVIRGQPAEAFPKLFKEWKTTCLTFEEDPEPYGKVRDQNVTEMCKEFGVEVIVAVSHTLFKLDTIIEKNGGKPPLTYYQFQSIIASMDPPAQSEQAITPECLGTTYTPIMDDHDDKYNVPTLEELGFDTEGLKAPVWVGGETEALARLERHLERKAWVASFGRPKMTPQSLLASQTGLSPYLRFGCLSTRLFYHQLTDLYKKIKKAMPPLSLHGQLLWREFFYCAATRNANFDKMEGNQICVQIPWDKNAEALAKWANGHTGFPWIDAIMTQLREEGWIHHLARHAVACFLTRGDLWISWEEGMKVFEELLLDADWSVNAGMWMWLSCSSFFQQFFHCYCPVRFGRKADPNGDYIRKYLPVLKNFPAKYIHEPWNAPESVQKTAKCIIGKDYPVPMVNHAVVSRTNMERMKQVYQHLTKYRVPREEKENPNKGVSAIADYLAAASHTQSYIPYAISSPSPTTVIANTNNSGNYLCQQWTPNSQQKSAIVSRDRILTVNTTSTITQNEYENQLTSQRSNNMSQNVLPLNMSERDVKDRNQTNQQQLAMQRQYYETQRLNLENTRHQHQDRSLSQTYSHIKISSENPYYANNKPIITDDNLTYRKERINNSVIMHYGYYRPIEHENGFTVPDNYCNVYPGTGNNQCNHREVIVSPHSNNIAYRNQSSIPENEMIFRRNNQEQLLQQQHQQDRQHLQQHQLEAQQMIDVKAENEDCQTRAPSSNLFANYLQLHS
ncbi:cryptochrome-1-like isoform X2 [Condylostylus longicornis]|uniref:cryptochrome-1-like isoform X2 n=1 Tax=Condylostylus longicornis TaxID=2530218 RepID=UPI00244DCD42|nr:cryptochrome-1-like isoform X2 [Condylostylus longicornis]